MREILFRGKRMDNGEWVEGDLWDGKSVMVFARDGFPGGPSWNEVDPATVGQFTGLEDKNGKRIFEGDVCRFREWSGGEMCWVGNVHYEHQQFVISGGPNKECDGSFCLQLSRFVSGNIEVIGNIHDPELLEVAKMAEYHVGCGAFAVYAGTLNSKNKSLWQNKTECTDEAINAVRDYMVQELLGGFDCRKAVSSGYEWTLKDGRVVELRISVKEVTPDE